ncbi:EamA family transporter [Gilvibacter sp. SZ-19]|jgi:drug/metabolite transporter (DMT)-like permease|uniref:EamA family transporter n=1 Tax=Gilvibacter sp. SZ-19 TaxID=754429 RepID=UPI000B3C85F5|nr:EamA family transporter [Gilvibacter sp. SZ-19]ARV13266.1 EamA family transporter [Gilvibacter sp. SZ-19]
MRSERVLIPLAFFAIYVIWGATYMLNKVAVAQLEPFYLAGIRFTTAGLLIFLIARLMGHKLSISWRQVRNTAFVGFLFLTYGNGVVVWALKFVDSNFAALEIAAQPLVVLLLMWILQGKRIQFKSMIGVFLGFIGMYLLISQDEILMGPNSLLGVLMIFSCMLSWGYGSLFVAKADMPKNYFVNTGFQMFFGGIMLLIASLAFGEAWVAPQQWKPDVQWVMLILVIFGSIAAFTSFNYLLKRVSPEKVATSTYVNPIIAMLLGWYVLQESISTQSIIAATVLLTGVYFINSGKRKKREKA